ncbi:MAG: TRAP transporter substrate-binding protein [Desulfobacteraceae bacterium]|nr:TRAP transporter substrate-binding protein [Desulfobacteraceae bacterium]
MKVDLKKIALLSIMFALFCLVNGATLVFAQEKPIELTMNVAIPEKAWAAQNDMAHFAKRINELTKGRVKINIFFGSTLSRPQDAYDSAADGIADIAWGSHANTPGRFPMMSIFNLLGVGHSMTASQNILADLYQQFPGIEAEHKDVKVLYLYAIKELTYFLKKPVRKLEDMKGLRLRATGIAGETLEAWGAAPIAMPLPEMYVALQRNIIDGTAADWNVALGFKLQEVTNFATIGPFPSTSAFMVMNLKKWNALPKDIQKILQEEGKKHWLEMGKPADGFTQRVIGIYKGIPGHEVHVLSPEERVRFLKAAQPVHEKWIADMEAKGLPGKKLFDATVKLSKKYDAMYPAPWLVH